MDKLAPLPIIPGMRRIRSLPLVPSAPEQRIDLQDNSFMLRSVSLILNFIDIYFFYCPSLGIKFFFQSWPDYWRHFLKVLQAFTDINNNSFFMKIAFLKPCFKKIVKKQGTSFLDFDSIEMENMRIVCY